MNSVASVYSKLIKITDSWKSALLLLKKDELRCTIMDQTDRLWDIQIVVDGSCNFEKVQ